MEKAESRPTWRPNISIYTDIINDIIDGICVLYDCHMAVSHSTQCNQH